MLDVFFYEAFAEEEEALRRYLPGPVKAAFTAATIQEAGQLEIPARLVSIRTQSIVPAVWAGGMEGILTRSTGYDHVAAWRRETGSTIPCGYLPSYCAVSVAEHALLMIFSLFRGLPRQMNQFRTFYRDDLTGREIDGRKLLVAGVGNIGREIVRLGRGVNMDVRGFDLLETVKGLTFVGLEEGLAWADAIVCALPLTEETRGMLGRHRLEKVNPGIVLVNISRGEITPVKDLLELLRERRLGGLALDVFEEEPELAVCLREGVPAKGAAARATLELQHETNVILTPHNAFNTREALERKARQSAEAAATFLKSARFPHPVPFGA